MIRTRFSPSPTGLLHLGNARTALFSALYAKKNQGVFILRIEDTDAARSEHQYTDQLQQDLHWFQIDWQEGPGVDGPHAPYWQSQRHGIYDGYYKKLEQAGLAYPCFCTDAELALNRKLQLSRGQAPRYPGTCRKLSNDDIQKKIAGGLKPALRFRITPKVTIEFTDLVKGPQKFNSDDVGDFIIRRAEGTSSFMFCNAIDDSLMGITHVIRGEDHLTNTPRQLMILKALDMRTPQYGHLAMILGEDGAPLSKRHGSFSLHDLYREGYLSKAVLNYLARLGNTYDTQNLMSFDELADHFQMEKLSRSPARFDHNQLLFWQKQCVMALSENDLKNWLGKEILNKLPLENQTLFFDLLKQNCVFPKEVEKWSAIFFDPHWKLSDAHHAELKSLGMNQHFLETWKKAIEQYGDDLKKILDYLKQQLAISGKQLFQPMRIVLTGETHGPELAQIVALLGREKILERINTLIL